MGITVFTAALVVTVDDEMSTAQAVAVDDGLIVAVGSLDEVIAALGNRVHTVDTKFADSVMLPGLIDQHLHPILGASKSFGRLPLIMLEIL